MHPAPNYRGANPFPQITGEAAGPEDAVAQKGDQDEVGVLTQRGKLG